MKKLDNLIFKPYFVSHLGCLDGCFEYYGMEISKPWLYGATGHGFILNIETNMCPSGPTAWNTAMIFQQSRKLGAEIDGIMAWKKEGNFSEKQEQAWNLIKKAIDHNQPCYGWQIGSIPDFDIIYGYDDIGYYYRCLQRFIQFHKNVFGPFALHPQYHSVRMHKVFYCLSFS